MDSVVGRSLDMVNLAFPWLHGYTAVKYASVGLHWFSRERLTRGHSSFLPGHFSIEMYIGEHENVIFIQSFPTFICDPERHAMHFINQNVCEKFSSETCLPICATSSLPHLESSLVWRCSWWLHWIKGYSILWEVI